MKMEKINIAKLLKDCPKGMELDCTSYDNVSFDKISAEKKATYPIHCYITDEKGNRSSISFTEDGCESKRYGAKCVIFPKFKTTWKEFVPPCKVEPMFKIGDRIKRKGHDDSGRIEKIEDNVYHVDYGYDDGIIRVNLNMQDDYELVHNKFDITTLKPFDKVLVRDNDEQLWSADLFGFYRKTLYPFMCVGHYTNQCVPYEGNEHLLGTTDDCDDFYKIWK